MSSMECGIKWAIFGENSSSVLRVSLQDLDNVTEYLQEECCGNSIKNQLTEVCWALAALYWTQSSARPLRLEPLGEEEESRSTVL